MTASSTPMPTPEWPAPRITGFGPSTAVGAAPIARRRRRWPWVVGLGAVTVAAGLTVLGVVGLDGALRHDLVTAHFDDTAAPFATGENDQSAASLVDGGYELRATATPDADIRSFAMFTRTAYNVTVHVTVAQLDDPSGDGAAGIGCLDLPETNGHGYLFYVAADEVGLVRLDNSGERNELLATAPVRDQWPLDGRTIGIACSPGSGDSVTVTGSVDGVEVVRVTDVDGFTRYEAALLLFHPYDAGDAVRFDDVIARVPGE